jgi:hypothetical protein
MKSYIIKSTRIKAKNPSELNAVRYYGGDIPLGPLGLAYHWLNEAGAKILGWEDAQLLLKFFIRDDKDFNYNYEIISI